jgi:hypothetical protein
MKRVELSMATTRVVTNVVELGLVDADSETDKTESRNCSSSPRVCTAVGQDMTLERGNHSGKHNCGKEFQADD